MTQRHDKKENIEFSSVDDARFSQIVTLLQNYIFDFKDATSLHDTEKNRIFSDIKGCLTNFTKISFEAKTPEKYAQILSLCKELQEILKKCGCERCIELDLFIVMAEKLKKRIEELPEKIEKGKKEVHEWMENIVKPSLITRKK